jgi:hypothetical protein
VTTTLQAGVEHCLQGRSAQFHRLYDDD